MHESNKEGGREGASEGGREGRGKEEGKEEGGMKEEKERNGGSVGNAATDDILCVICLSHSYHSNIHGVCINAHNLACISQPKFNCFVPMALFIVKIYQTTLRTFFTMAVDDVLPFSDLHSDDLLQLFDDYKSSSSTASLTVPVPASP